MKFAIISDPHNKFEPLFPILTEKYPEHHIIICGDIVDGGTAEEMRAARKALEPVKDRVSFAPGNHDCCECDPVTIPGITYSWDSALAFDEILAMPLLSHSYQFRSSYIHVFANETCKAVLVGLNSCLQTKSPFDFACGEIGELQLRSLDNILTAYTGFKRIVFLHHHPFLNPDTDIMYPFMRLLDAEDFWRVATKRNDDGTPNVALITFGHRHTRSMHWKNLWGIPHVLYSTATPKSEWFWELEIDKGDIRVRQEYWSKYART